MKKLVHKFLSGLSLTGALFAFQACYGTPQYMCSQVLVEGTVKDADGNPIKSVGVSHYGLSDADRECYRMDEHIVCLSSNDGGFSFYSAIGESKSIKFLFSQRANDGQWIAVKDTILSDINVDSTAVLRVDVIISSK
jgi:hypothetical protein